MFQHCASVGNKQEVPNVLFLLLLTAKPWGQQGTEVAPDTNQGTRLWHFQENMLATV